MENAEKKKFGWTEKGLIGLIFSVIGIIYLLITGLMRVAVPPSKDTRVILPVFTALGILLLVPGLVFAALDLRRRKMLRLAYEGGYWVMARVVGCRKIRHMRVNGRYPYVVECETDDVADGGKRTYTRRYLYDKPDPLPDEVRVYRDRYDGRWGFVDIDPLLEERKEEKRL